MNLDDILRTLEESRNPENVAGMARYGITAGRAYGVRIPRLRQIAKEAGRNRRLAHELWAVNTRETRILAGMIDDPILVTEDQLETWVLQFDSWEICDQCCANLIEKTSFAFDKAYSWSAREEEFVKRAGFVLMARLAVSDKTATDEAFLPFLPIIERESGDSRNFVKKGVNWALRQIGKRNLRLNRRALDTAEKLLTLDSAAARWNGRNAHRELSSPAVQERLQRTASP